MRKILAIIIICAIVLLTISLEILIAQAGPNDPVQAPTFTRGPSPTPTGRPTAIFTPIPASITFPEKTDIEFRGEYRGMGLRGTR